MKRVLILAYYYPPLGMGGVQRALKFTRYLPEFGWEPVVVTVKDVRYYAKDPSLLREIEWRTILRTESLDPLRMAYHFSGKHTQSEYPSRPRWTTGKRLYRFLDNALLIPDSKRLWTPFAVRAALRYMQSHSVDLIFSTSPPHSAHLAGLSLKKRTDLPWVADFRDSWVDLQNTTSCRQRLNRKMAVRVMRTADRIVAVSGPIAEDMLRISGKNPDDAIAIPNGYDRNDFEDVEPSESDRFTVTYCGAMSRMLDPTILLDAVAALVRERPEIRTQLSLHLVGAALDIPLADLVSQRGLTDCVQLAGYVPHAESIQYLMSADLLYFMLPREADCGMVTGKVFEYLASGKPVVASVPQCEAGRLIVKHARGVIVPPGDVRKLAGELGRAYDLWKRGDLKLSVPRWKGIESLDRKNQIQQLATIFDNLVNERG